MTDRELIEKLVTLIAVGDFHNCYRVEHDDLIAEARAALAGPVVSAEEWLAEAERLFVLFRNATTMQNETAVRAHLRTHPALAVPEGVLAEVAAERAKQDAKWGGPKHDDQHSTRDFNRFIYSRVKDSNLCGKAKDQRPYMVQIAALAVANIERIDRELEAEARSQQRKDDEVDQ